MATLPISLQMYTLRDVKMDFVELLKKAAEIGYRGVEANAPSGMSAAEFRKVLDDLGLALTGTHVGIDVLEKDLDKAADDAKTAGTKWVVCPWIPSDRCDSAEAWKRIAAQFNKIGAKCKKAGLVFCYHNHSFEFKKFDGKCGLDILYSESDPDLVKAELDTYWVRHGGGNPAEYVKKYASRCPLVHMKDMENDAARSFAEVGEGILDWKAILAECKKAKVAWHIVEQDTCKRPPLESVEISFKNLKKMLEGGCC